jgi:hypothetical protein
VTGVVAVPPADAPPREAGREADDAAAALDWDARLPPLFAVVVVVVVVIILPAVFSRSRKLTVTPYSSFIVIAAPRRPGFSCVMMLERCYSCVGPLVIVNG